MVLLSTLQSINQKAIGLMQAKMFKSATDLLSDGLALLDRSTSSSQSEVPSSTHPPTAFGSMLLVGIADKKQSSSSKMKDDKSTFFVYDNAITLVRPVNTYTAVQETCPRLRQLMHSILLYNLGLSLHFRGTTTNGSSQEADNCLNEACMAYEMGLGIVTRFLSNAPNHICDEDYTVLVFLELALLNNCGVIYHHFVDIGQAHVCLHQMLLLVNSMTRKYGWKDTFPQALSPFAHNIMFNADQSKRPAPVA